MRYRLTCYDMDGKHVRTIAKDGATARRLIGHAFATMALRHYGDMIDPEERAEWLEGFATWVRVMTKPGATIRHALEIFHDFWGPGWSPVDGVRITVKRTGARPDPVSRNLLPAREG